MCQRPSLSTGNLYLLQRNLFYRNSNTVGRHIFNLLEQEDGRFEILIRYITAPSECELAVYLIYSHYI